MNLTIKGIILVNERTKVTDVILYT